MSLIGLDLNATRARAVYGAARGVPLPLPLEGQDSELPLALSLECNTPLVGRTGVALSRAMPHLACLDFLPQLGLGQQWTAGRHRLDAADALAVAFDHLGRCFGRQASVFVALPPYLSEVQEVRLTRLAKEAHWRLLGTVSTPLAAALAGRQYLPSTGIALVLDADNHALTWSAVEIEEGTLRLLSTVPSLRLGVNAWLNRLLEQVAHRCILLSRRDPRAAADSEQALFDQLRRFLTAPANTPRIDFVLQTRSWSQHLMFQPDELEKFCAPLVQQTMAQLSSFLAAAAIAGPMSCVLLTQSAAALPGLVQALRTWLHQTKPPPPPMADAPDPEFGDALLLEDSVPSSSLQVLDVNAIANSCHELAGRVVGGELPLGPLQVLALPQPRAPQPEAEAVRPAVLEFRGQQHILSSPVFTLGRDPACNLVFETELYPTVSARHCEIVLDRRTYTLRDRSRHGTLVNDQPVNQQVSLHPGDWIRLGPVGPVLRFLGNT